MGGTIRLAVGEYAFGEGGFLDLRTERLRLLDEEGVAITRAV